VSCYGRQRNDWIVPYGGDCNQRNVARTLDGPFVFLFEQDGAEVSVVVVARLLRDGVDVTCARRSLCS